MKRLLTGLSTALGVVAFMSGADAAPRTEGPPAGIVQIDHRAGHDFGWRERMLPERRIARILARRGFVSVEDIELRRDRYVVRAVRPNGALVRLAIDAYDGRIIARERIGWVNDRGWRSGGGHWQAPGFGFRFGGSSLGPYGR